MAQICVMLNPFLLCYVLLAPLSSKKCFLLLTHFLTLGLITRDAVMGLVVSMASLWRLEKLEQILMLMNLELAALFGPMNAFAGLMMQSSSF